jgi:hypothetical protein
METSGGAKMSLLEEAKARAAASKGSTSAKGKSFNFFNMWNNVNLWNWRHLFLSE